MSTVIVAYARMNPPHEGHAMLIDKVKSLSKLHGYEYKIIISRTHDHKKNPLDPDNKLWYLNELFPDTNFVLATEELPSLMHHVKELNAIHKDLIIVCGSDRLAEYALLYFKYNKKEYLYNSIRTVSAGDRTLSTNTASSSEMRKFALEEKLPEFINYLPTDDQDVAEDLYQDVRSSLLININKQKSRFIDDNEKENSKT